MPTSWPSSVLSSTTTLAPYVFEGADFGMMGASDGERIASGFTREQGAEGSTVHAVVPVPAGVCALEGACTEEGGPYAVSLETLATDTVQSSVQPFASISEPAEHPVEVVSSKPDTLQHLD